MPEDVVTTTIANAVATTAVAEAISEVIDASVTTTKNTYADAIAAYFPIVDQFYIPDWFTIQFIANNIISFTPLFSYGTTVISIQRSQTSLGFSLDICATMLIASILRVCYYLITPYDLSLLRQSLVMIFIQLILLNTTLKFRPIEYQYDNLLAVESFQKLFHDIFLEYFATDKPLQNWKTIINNLTFTKVTGFLGKCGLVIVYKTLKFFDPSYKRILSFWQWNNDTIFWKFIAYFACLNFFFTLFVVKIMDWPTIAEWVGSIFGSLGLLIESLLPLPQISILHKLKSIQGFKLILLVSWLCGDTLKITYLIFGASNISYMFVVFALFQMSLDFYIAGQYIYYRFYYETFRHDNEASMALNTGDIELRNFNVTVDGSSNNNSY
ncbi:hypothetical protein TPHA_0H02510 [Tetrapisispora phaffii CBS 4417]|uniref:PQ-loop repeat-containing protein 1 n=1 Tax=Tetrapisispora phaffii (strain ATCC 24235 / CBS 4417 / NBRC 1672 / NRRL Y-8282 / UCD 70-5) TaxID=1071381 RepID=G8BWK3_TETPH|nr:hypothetical protein TPHA_0H02510 [Tetrapisispora phaffii CBS 4417]CCE64454.1 hypothetical protein TPHA_0H02510 [Tetrapisispora phaffii CBS 4417]